jgi:hypothetical protein
MADWRSPLSGSSDTTTTSKSQGRKKTTDNRTPTAYSYCIEGHQATETFSMGREKSLDVQFEGVHAGVVDDDVDILIPEHLYRPWESGRE